MKYSSYYISLFSNCQNTGCARAVIRMEAARNLAWSFLTQEWPFEDTVTTPLALLKAGRIDDVLGAAAGFGATFS